MKRESADFTVTKLCGAVDNAWRSNQLLRSLRGLFSDKRTLDEILRSEWIPEVERSEASVEQLFDPFPKSLRLRPTPRINPPVEFRTGRFDSELETPVRRHATIIGDGELYPKGTGLEFATRNVAKRSAGIV